MKYYVSLEGTEHEVVIDGERVSVDGEPVQARIERLSGTPVDVLTIEGQVHQVIARRGDEKGTFDLSLGGRRFRTEAVDERARTIRQLSAAATTAHAPAHLKAPMPGLIVRVNVSEGEKVTAGQGLVVMEAMKMENELRASATGIVKKILVSPGSAVDKGAILLELEG